MKKLISALALAGLVGGVVAATNKDASAMPPPPSQAVRIVCDGGIQCCQGSALREFVYRVKVPGGGLVSVSSIDVGTHDPVLSDYTDLILPTGWSLSILPAPPPPAFPDAGFNCTTHGGVSSIVGNCPYVLHFAGPAKTSNFTLAYNFLPNWDTHDVAWKSSNGNSAKWAAQVGLGNGPVHAPLMP